MGDKKPQRTESSMIFKPDDFPLKASIDYELPLQGGLSTEKKKRAIYISIFFLAFQLEI